MRNQRTEIITAGHNRMRLDSLDSLRLQKNKIYERAETAIMTAEAMGNPDKTVLDIGAHIGYFSLIAWRQQKGYAGAGGVFAFEPDPLNFQILKENIFINTAEGIGAVEMAISDKTGSGTLYLCPTNSGDHRIVIGTRTEGRERIPIKTSRLDDLDFIDWGRVGMVKIDTQGAEVKVLMGASKLLSQKKMKMIIEFWPWGLKEAGSSADELLQAIYSAGFRICDIRGSMTPVPKAGFTALSKNYAAMGRHSNLFCEKGR